MFPMEDYPMTQSTVERRVRALLSVSRFLQAYLPLQVSRSLIKQGMARVRLADDVTRQAVTADGVSCEWLIPQNSPTDQALLYLHGGGFVFGMMNTHLEMVAYVAQKMGIRALVVDYRLAPDHPFPAALDDCVTAYRWLLRQGISAQKIVVAGDSAGGTLAITTMMKLRDCGDALPAAAASLSPAAHLLDRGMSFSDALLHPRATRKWFQSYVAQNDVRNPLISPEFGAWHDLPPLLVYAGGEELLRDDAARIEELARAAGVDVRLEIYPRMWHVWQLFRQLPEAVQSLDEIAQFLKTHTETGQ
jgi:monoterpene epsilon-lactone hydrolase